MQGKSLIFSKDFPCTFKIFLNTQNHPSRNLKIIFGGPAGLFVTLKNVYQVFSIRGTGYRRFQMIRACPDFVSKEMYRRGASSSDAEENSDFEITHEFSGQIGFITHEFFIGFISHDFFRTNWNGPSE